MATEKRANALTVLVIDDHEENRLLLERQLTSVPDWDLIVHAAGEAGEALRSLKEVPCDLVLLDYKLPGTDGLALLDKIRQHHPKTAVVMVTAAGNEQVAVAAMKKGALDYMSHTDVNPAVLTHLFRRIIETRYLVDQNMELRQVNQMKNEFLANVSHELRTPLSVIIGYAETLKEGSLGPTSAPQDKALDSIIGRAQGLLQTLNQILRIRESHEGKEALLLKPLDLRTLLSERAQRPSRDMTRKRITVVLSLPKDEVWVMADREKLAEAVDNLLLNAAKFGPEGSTVRLALESRPGEALVAVEDRGQGVAPEMLPRLFERFSAAALGPTREHGGLGLGLPLAKQIVEQHRGRIWLESQAGQGTTAYFALPLASEETPTISAEVPAKLEKKRILVVEDNPDIVELLILFLSGISKNIEVSTAATGFEALDQVKNSTPHAIILDLMMPGMDGFEVIARLKRLPETERIPVMVLTGYAEAAEKAKRIGAQEVLLKPFAAEVFTEKILRLLKESPVKA